MNYIVKIPWGKSPVIVPCGDTLPETVQNLLDNGKTARLWRDVTAYCSGLILVTTDSAGNRNRCASRLASPASEEIYGTAYIVICEGGVYRPLNETEAVDIRDTIEQLYDIEFEEGDEK